MNGQQLIDSDPTVRKVAVALGLQRSSNLKNAIRAAAVSRVETWIQELNDEPTTLDDLHQLVLNRTRVKVFRVESDEDLVSATEQVKRTNPAAPVQLAFEFRDQTEAVVIRRDDADRCSASRYVAIVDARGDRRFRAWFGERHEPSHLVIGDPSSNVVWRRTKKTRPEPIEQVVDAVASAIGFWEPIVKPILMYNLSMRKFLLDAFDATRKQLAPRASRESCYRAFVAMMDRPVVLVRVDFDGRARDSSSVASMLNSLALRAKTIISNSAADVIGMAIWSNYRIPEESVIQRAYGQASSIRLVENDDLRSLADQEREGSQLAQSEGGGRRVLGKY